MIYWDQNFTERKCIHKLFVVLGMESDRIKDSQLTASTSKASLMPRYGRLNQMTTTLPPRGAWCARDDDPQPYFQVDLGLLTEVTQIATQGRQFFNQFARNFTISYSSNGFLWTPYTSNGTTVMVCNYFISYFHIFTWLKIDVGEVYKCYTLFFFKNNFIRTRASDFDTSYEQFQNKPRLNISRSI